MKKLNLYMYIQLYKKVKSTLLTIMLCHSLYDIYNNKNID